MKEQIEIQFEGGCLIGDLNLPRDTQRLVLFAHGSGSGRLSPRNQYVAGSLYVAGMGTLLVDLLTTEEEEQDRATGHLRFDIALLAQRLNESIDYLKEDERTATMPLGLFGASTGAAAALVCAASRPQDVAAVVCRGGRPDLAEPVLPAVLAPTLLVVGSRDEEVLRLNRQAQAQLGGQSELVLVPGASHLFEEPGKLDDVSAAAIDWFCEHLPAGAPTD
jgi:putative phosphoribosyl transferase